MRGQHAGRRSELLMGAKSTLGRRRGEQPALRRRQLACTKAVSLPGAGPSLVRIQAKRPAAQLARAALAGC